MPHGLTDQSLGTGALVAHSRLTPLFHSASSQQRCLAYLRGLLSDVERKNGWQLSEWLGERSPDNIQYFLERAHWDAEAARDVLRNYVTEHLGDEQSILIIDETGFIKKGAHSAGVQRQYSGTAGRVENSQIGVFLCYAGHSGHAFIDRALYLPEQWTADHPHCEAAGIPDSVSFATKPQLARQMLERAFSAGVPCRWVTAACDAGWKPGINLLSSRSLRMNHFGGKRLAMSGRT
ncbi:IS701 family transposase [Xenorhabdus khoisanae]